MREDDITRNRHGGNPESVTANLITAKSRDRGRILSYLLNHPEGATADDLAAALDLPSQTASARCSELLRDGLAIRRPRADDPLRYVRRLTRQGCPAAVLVIAAADLRLKEKG